MQWLPPLISIIGWALIAVGARLTWLGFVKLFPPEKFSGPEALSHALLRANLTPVQLHEFDAYGTIPVVGGFTGTLYRIRRSVSANVQIVKASPHQFAPEGKKHLCFMPLATLPMSDTMLAQKIALESDELHVLAIAGRF